MSKILINNTASNVILSDVGQTVPASGSLTISPSDYDKYAQSSNVITKISDLAVNPTTSTLKVNDGSFDLSISEGSDLLKGIFPRKIIGGTDGTAIGNVGDSLKVNTVITPSSGTIPSVSCKLRYIDMNASNGGVARATLITNASFVDIFSYTGSGVLLSMLINIEEKNKWQVKLTVDSDEIFNSTGLLTGDLVNDSIYDLDDAGSPLSPNEGSLGLSLEEHDRIIWSCPSGFPIRYTTSVVVSLKRIAGEPSKKFNAGLIILTKDT